MIGKHVVITGGEGDLAEVISRELLSTGYDVAAPGHQSLDVCDPQSVESYFVGKSVDLLICCAGLTRDELLVRMTEEDWNLVWETNYLGAKRCANAVLGEMNRQRKGHIVFVSSHSAFLTPPGQAAYAAAKRALIGLTRDLALGHGPNNIRVHAILPGFLENRMTAGLSERRKDEVRNEHALGRFNTMDRVAAFVRFLHEEMPHTSGQWFSLDSRPGTI